MPSRWKTVRIFISSTFKDMHAERDHLVRVVFPELKARCRKLRLHLIDVDLRWGVTEKDAESGKALDICLDEIDSCRPYFLGLLAHRYGWIPPGASHSITAQEIYHGVLHGYVPTQIIDLRQIIEDKLESRPLSNEQKNTLVRCYPFDPERQKYVLKHDLTEEDKDIVRTVFQRYLTYQRDRSFFFFRKESLSKKLAEESDDNEAVYFEQEDSPQQKLIALKEEIVRSGLFFVEYDDIESFGQLVQDKLWSRISAEAESADEEKEWWQEEADFQEQFIAERTRRFFGRRELLDRLHAFTVSSGTSVFVLTGQPGSGKSAVLARFTEELQQPHINLAVIPHFVGASPASATLPALLRRFCIMMSHLYGFEQQKNELLSKLTGDDEETRKERARILEHFRIPEEPRELSRVFRSFLERAPAHLKLLFIIDGANQLDVGTSALRWLPQKLPPNIKFLISTLPGITHRALMARASKPEVAEVPPLTTTEIKGMVENFLTEIRHQFPNRLAEETFYNKVESGNPLYITVALEELRIFARFEGIQEKIDSLPATVPELFNQVLLRIEKDFSAALVKDCMTFLACGRDGMTAEELQVLLRMHAPALASSGQPLKLPDLMWNRLYRSFFAYTFERSGVIDFFHNQFKEAVGRRYLNDEADRTDAHLKIAEYFAVRWKEPYLRSIDELPHQYAKAKANDDLQHILTDLKFIEAKCGAGMAYRLPEDYEAGDPQKVTTDFWEFYDFIRRNIHVLSADSSLTFQQAINEPDGTAPAKTAALQSQQEKRAWLRRINKPQQNPPCRITVSGHSKTIRSCDFAIDGQTIVSASEDGSVRLWDCRSGEEIYSMTDHEEAPVFCCFHPDGRRIISASSTEMIISDAETGVPVDIIPLTDAYSFDFSSNGRLMLIGGSWKGTVHQYDFETRMTKKIAQFERVGMCRFSADMKWIACVTELEVHLIDLQTGNPIHTFTHPYPVVDFSFCSDGIRLVTAAAESSVWSLQPKNTMTIWDLRSFQKTLSFETTAQLTCCIFSPEGESIATGDRDHTVRIWNAEMGRESAVFVGHSYRITAIAFSKHGDKIASGSSDNTLKIWDAAYTAAAHQHHLGLIEACSFSRDGNLIVTGSADKTAKIWNGRSGDELFVLPGYRSSVVLASFSPDSDRVLTYTWDDPAVKLWDARSGKEVKTLLEIQKLGDASFSPDGKRVLVVGSYDPAIRLFDPSDGKFVAALKHGSTIWGHEFSLDGSLLVSASSDQTVRVWQTKNGRKVATLRGHTAEVHHAAISPDCSFVVSASKDNTVRLWNLKTRKTVAGFQGNSYCCFSPDGSRLLYQNKSEELRIFDLAAQKESASKHCNKNTIVNLRPVASYGVYVLKDEDSIKIIDACTDMLIGALKLEEEEAKWQFSADGKYIVAQLSTGMIHVYDLHKSEAIAKYPATVQILAGRTVDWSIQGVICIGSSDGALHLLAPQNFNVYPPLVTARQPRKRSWPFGPLRPADTLNVRCPFCNRWFESALSNLGQDVDCFHCKQSLHLRPFAIETTTKV